MTDCQHIHISNIYINVIGWEKKFSQQVSWPKDEIQKSHFHECEMKADRHVTSDRLTALFVIFTLQAFPCISTGVYGQWSVCVRDHHDSCTLCLCVLFLSKIQLHFQQQNLLCVCLCACTHCTHCLFSQSAEPPCATCHIISCSPEVVLRLRPWIKTGRLR